MSHAFLCIMWIRYEIDNQWIKKKNNPIKRVGTPSRHLVSTGKLIPANEFLQALSWEIRKIRGWSIFKSKNYAIMII